MMKQMIQSIAIPDHENLSFLQVKKQLAVTSDTAELVDLIIKNENHQSALTLLDLGTGTGIIPFILSQTLKNWSFTGIEIQDHLCQIAHQNKTEQNMNNFSLVCDNVKNIQLYPFQNAFDRVVSNPPYYKANQGIVSPNNMKAISRHELYADMNDFLKAFKYCLKPEGKGYCLYPEFRENDIFLLLKKNHLMLVNKYELSGLNVKNKKYIYEIKHAGN